MKTWDVLLVASVLTACARPPATTTYTPGVAAPGRYVRRVESQASPVVYAPLVPVDPPPAPNVVAVVPAAPSPMDLARACLRASSDMAAGNECLIRVLRDRATGDSEMAPSRPIYRPGTAPRRWLE